MLLIFNNARTYNKPGSDVHVMANTIQVRLETQVWVQGRASHGLRAGGRLVAGSAASPRGCIWQAYGIASAIYLNSVA